jgi:predicted RNA binding protein YcfA (HicA-like mRNA interferase family)
MSEHLPVISGKQIVKILIEQGWYISRQRGSHVMMKKAGVFFTVSVPQHKILDKGTLSGILDDVGLSQEEFRKLL